jgi:hypothetical protein
MILVGALCASCAAFWSLSADYAGDLIKVPHGRHRVAKVDCVACHEEVYDEKTLAEAPRTPEAKCLECHRDEKQKGNCGFCHTDVRKAKAQRAATPELKLSHAGHVERAKEDCAQCHQKLPDPVRTRADVPTMASCLACHEHRADYDRGHCDVCHKDLARYAIKPVSDYSHVGDYVRDHARDARASVDACARCHEQSFCTDCHASTVATRIEIKASERVDRDFIHRNDYLTRHAIEAAADPALCRRCHGSSFCTACHSSQNLTEVAASPRDPHPAGWSIPGAASFHGPAARQDIASCAACHDEGRRSICIDCHKVGGNGGNPHPPAWMQRHPASEIHSNSMCLYCHL